MAEKIKWWMCCICIFIGMIGLMFCFEWRSLNEEILNLNKQVKQQSMLIDYLEQERMTNDR